MVLTRSNLHVPGLQGLEDSVVEDVKELDEVVSETKLVFHSAWDPLVKDLTFTYSIARSPSSF